AATPNHRVMRWWRRDSGESARTGAASWASIMLRCCHYPIVFGRWAERESAGKLALSIQFIAFGSSLGSVEEELPAVAILLAQDGICAELRGLRLGGSADGAVLEFVGNVQIAPAVVVRAEFTLQVSDQLAERLPFFRHYIRQQERVENAIAFREKA